MKMTSNMMKTSNWKTTLDRKTILNMKMTCIMNTNSNIRTALNMKRTSIKEKQAKSTKPNLQKQVFQTEQNIQIFKVTKAKPKNSIQSLSLPWAWHSSAPACSWLKIVLHPELSLNQNAFLDPILMSQNYSCKKFLFDARFLLFLPKAFLDPKGFFVPNHFCTEISFWNESFILSVWFHAPT